MSTIDLSTVDPKTLTHEQLVTLVENLKKQEVKKKSLKKAPRKDFDFQKWNFRHVAFKISYVGWNYNGFAVQENVKTTVEEEIYKAFETTRLIQNRGDCGYSRCGRTDKGVSGLGQVIALNVRTNLDSGIGVLDSKNVKKSDTEMDYMKMLNGVLPRDIRVLGWWPVKKEFNARFDCKYRKYKYYFVKGDLDLDLMNDAAQLFVGSHDFQNFCKINGEVKHFIRKVIKIKIQKSKGILNGNGENTIYEVVIHGWSFLWHQVRCMVAILFMIGNGSEKKDIIATLLDVEKTKVRPQYNMADEWGLCLYDCKFDEIQGWNQCNTVEGQQQVQERIYNEFSKNCLENALWGNMCIRLEKNSIVHQGKEIPWTEIKNTLSTPKHHVIMMDRSDPSSEPNRKKTKLDL